MRLLERRAIPTREGEGELQAVLDLPPVQPGAARASTLIDALLSAA